MKVFICSRMNELEPERKAAIDSLAISGCIPIYIERQISAYGDKEAKDIMDRMIDDADALVLIYPRWKGKARQILAGKTPTQYEFAKFYAKIKRMGRDVETYVRVFRKSVIEESEMDRFIARFSDIKPIPYDSHVQLAGNVYDLGRQLCSGHRDVRSDIKGSVVVRYNGPDFRGLLEGLSDMLSRGAKVDHRTTYVANLDRISFASGANVATVNFSCSLVEGVPDLQDLEKFLNVGMRREIAKAKKDHRLERKAKVPTKLVHVTHSVSTAPPFQFFMEVRTIDQPGQLHAVARVLRELKYSIDELQLRPAERGYPRQTIMTLWVSKESGLSTADELERDLVKLETAVRELAGVRSFSLRPTEMGQ